MEERKKRPGWASLGVGAIILVFQVLIYYVLNFSLGWRGVVIAFAFLAVGLVLGFISLFEKSERVPGIPGFTLNILLIIHQILLVVKPGCMDFLFK